ncbi:hypothetical protein ACFIN9_26600 [Streptomyces noursei]|uniref:hypothetical protein n=1 Tax=Streptomyces noursei TaxID=1971 RepID=UPI0036D3D561
MNEQLEHLCAARLDARTEWDEQPELLVVQGRRRDGLQMRRLPVPDSVWDSVSAPDVPRLYAQAVILGGAPPMRDLAAVALRCEGYALNSDSSPQADEVIRRRLAGGSTPRNADLPDRIEQRMLTALGIDGRVYFASADRRSDGGADPAVTKVHATDRPMTGRIPTALDALLTALRAHPVSDQIGF